MRNIISAASRGSVIARIQKTGVEVLRKNAESRSLSDQEVSPCICLVGEILSGTNSESDVPYHNNAMGEAMAGKFDLYKDKAGEHRFRLKASNGQSILVSEGYSSRAGAENGIESVRKNAAVTDRFEIRESKSGKPYFVLKAGNGQVIGQSEMYESASACQSAIASVTRDAPEATIDDQT